MPLPHNRCPWQCQCVQSLTATIIKQTLTSVILTITLLRFVLALMLVMTAARLSVCAWGTCEDGEDCVSVYRFLTSVFVNATSVMPGCDVTRLRRDRWATDSGAVRCKQPQTLCRTNTIAFVWKEYGSEAWRPAFEVVFPLCSGLYPTLMEDMEPMVPSVTFPGTCGQGSRFLVQGTCAWNTSQCWQHRHVTDNKHDQCINNNNAVNTTCAGKASEMQGTRICRKVQSRQHPLRSV